jgi:hypothetical protein
MAATPFNSERLLNISLRLRHNITGGPGPIVRLTIASNINYDMCFVYLQSTGSPHSISWLGKGNEQSVLVRIRHHRSGFVLGANHVRSGSDRLIEAMPSPHWIPSVVTPDLSYGDHHHRSLLSPVCLRPNPSPTTNIKPRLANANKPPPLFQPNDYACLYSYIINRRVPPQA